MPKIEICTETRCSKNNPTAIKNCKDPFMRKRIGRCPIKEDFENEDKKNKT